LRDFGERSEVAFGDSVARRPQVVSLSGDPGGIVRRGLGGPFHAAARADLLLTLRRDRDRDLELPIGAAEQRLREAVGAVGRTTRVHLDEAAEYISGVGARATARAHAEPARRKIQIERAGGGRHERGDARRRGREYRASREVVRARDARTRPDSGALTK